MWTDESRTGVPVSCIGSFIDSHLCSIRDHAKVVYTNILRNTADCKVFVVAIKVDGWHNWRTINSVCVVYCVQDAEVIEASCLIEDRRKIFKASLTCISILARDISKRRNLLLTWADAFNVLFLEILEAGKDTLFLGLDFATSALRFFNSSFK